MKYKKRILCMIVGIFCAGLFSGCVRLPWDFHSSQEAQKYVLRRLENKYHKPFVFTEEPEYKEEKIGIHWIRGKIAPEDAPEQEAYVYARNTAMFTDNYHAYYYADSLIPLAEALFAGKEYIKDMEITVSGRRSSTKWSGKEPLEEYIEKGEYQIYADVYLYENLTDEEYVEQVCLLIRTISGCGLHVQLDVWDTEDEWIFRAFPDDGELAEDKENILKTIYSHRSLMESLEDYEKWKAEQEQSVEESRPE